MAFTLTHTDLGGPDNVNTYTVCTHIIGNSGADGARTDFEDILIFDNSTHFNDVTVGNLKAIYLGGTASLGRLVWGETTRSPLLTISQPVDNRVFEFDDWCPLVNPNGTGANGNLYLRVGASAASYAMTTANPGIVIVRVSPA